MTTPLKRETPEGIPGRAGRPTEIIRGVSLDVARARWSASSARAGRASRRFCTASRGWRPADAGTITIDGVDIGALSPTTTGAVPSGEGGLRVQSYNLIPALTVRENVTLPLRLARGRVVESEVQAALRPSGSPSWRTSVPVRSPAGNSSESRSPASSPPVPRVVFADEPTGALDTVTGSVVLDLLRERARGDRSVVMVTHDLDAAARADRVLVLQDGLIREELRDPDPRRVFDAVARASAWRTGQ